MNLTCVWVQRGTHHISRKKNCTSGVDSKSIWNGRKKVSLVWNLSHSGIQRIEKADKFTKIGVLDKRGDNPRCWLYQSLGEVDYSQYGFKENQGMWNARIDWSLTMRLVKDPFKARGLKVTLLRLNRGNGSVNRLLFPEQTTQHIRQEEWSISW